MMIATQNLYDPIMPSAQESIIAEQCSRALASQMGKTENLRLRLDEGSDIILPSSILRLLVDALVQIAQGNAITIMPIHAEITTQQAADFLNVSRPYLVDELLEKGFIPFRKVGTRRRILFSDVIDYKKKIDAARLETLSRMVEHDELSGLGIDL